MAKYYFSLFNSQEINDERVFSDIKKSLAESNNISMDKVPNEWVYDVFSDYINDVKQDLDIETDGYIVAYCKIGLWSGNAIGYRTFGTNIKNIFDYCGCDDGEWYTDRYNVRAVLSHHDGKNYLVFRYVKDENTLERVCNNIYNGKIRTEDNFFRVTKSILPFIAKAFGWKNYGSISHKKQPESTVENPVLLEAVR